MNEVEYFVHVAVGAKLVTHLSKQCTQFFSADLFTGLAKKAEVRCHFAESKAAKILRYIIFLKYLL
jgi:hypothetical protein